MGMPAPFIIWTFRRTGGSALSLLLKARSGFGAWEDEALNLDRELGHISHSGQRGGDRARLDSEMQAMLAERKCLKHCIETVPWPVTDALLRHSHAAGYGHVLLLRLNETERQLSLLLANATGAWNGHDAWDRHRALREGTLRLAPANLEALQEQMTHDASLLGRLQRLLYAHDVSFLPVFYEHLYSGTLAARLAAFAPLAAHLGLPAPSPHDAELQHTLMEQGQNSRAIYGFLPNLDAVQAMVADYMG